jgi:hypothetical protein
MELKVSERELFDPKAPMWRNVLVSINKIKLPFEIFSRGKSEADKNRM